MWQDTLGHEGHLPQWYFASGNSRVEAAMWQGLHRRENRSSQHGFASADPPVPITANARLLENRSAPNGMNDDLRGRKTKAGRMYANIIEMRTKYLYCIFN
jgi:hypothetical protein